MVPISNEVVLEEDATDILIIELTLHLFGNIYISIGIWLSYLIFVAGLFIYLYICFRWAVQTAH